MCSPSSTWSLGVSVALERAPALVHLEGFQSPRLAGSGAGSGWYVAGRQPSGAHHDQVIVLRRPTCKGPRKCELLSHLYGNSTCQAEMCRLVGRSTSRAGASQQARTGDAHPSSRGQGIAGKLGRQPCCCRYVRKESVASSFLTTQKKKTHQGSRHDGAVSHRLLRRFRSPSTMPSLKRSGSDLRSARLCAQASCPGSTSRDARSSERCCTREVAQKGTPPCRRSPMCCTSRPGSAPGEGDANDQSALADVGDGRVLHHARQPGHHTPQHFASPAPELNSPSQVPPCMSQSPL